MSEDALHNVVLLHTFADSAPTQACCVQVGDGGECAYVAKIVCEMLAIDHNVGKAVAVTLMQNQLAIERSWLGVEEEMMTCYVELQATAHPHMSILLLCRLVEMTSPAAIRMYDGFDEDDRRDRDNVIVQAFWQ